ncbi:MAG: hypothetical protein AB8H03_04640 [Saprospiraceae bacterium]
MMQKYTSSFQVKFSLLFFVIVLFFLSSCRKESGDQCFDNRTDEPIDLYIDGFYEFTLDEDSEDCLFFGDGCYDWYAEGVLSGYYLEGTFCVGDGNFSSTIVIDD